MKRVISVILILALMMMTAACGADSENDAEKDNGINVSDNVQTDTDTDDLTAGDDDAANGDAAADKTDKNTSEDKSSAGKDKDKNNNSSASSDKTQNGGQSGSTDQNDKDDQNSSSGSSATVAQTLMADFKACAGSISGAQGIADRMIKNEVIKFAGTTMAVSPGTLAGFGNAEITGFSEGVMFSPVIGSIPFIGYIFVLDDGTDADGFVNTLKSNADQRWNICTQADETAVTSVGNKVFFVMSPKSFE